MEIQLTITIDFISSKDDDEEHVMHSKSDNIEIRISDDADEVIKKRFDSLKIDIKIILNQLEVERLSSIMSSYCNPRWIIYRFS